jgi:hypothetical protein
VLASSVVAQSKVPFDQDNHAFRFVLSSLQLRPLSLPEDAFFNPDQSIVIVFGQTAILQRAPSLMRFVQDGGALMIATDRETHGALEREFGVRVSGLLAEASPRTPMYRQSEECPLVQPVPNAKPPLFQTPNPVASNKPSFLVRYANGGKPLARLAEFPAGCRITFRQRFTQWPDPLVFAMGGDLGKGRILVLADHSVFINGMMLQSDNGNFDFAYNSVKWLNDSGKRPNVLFVDEGTIVQDFTVPLTTLPAPPISPLDAADRVIAALEEENLLNKLILEHLSLPQIIRGWTVALTVGLMLYGFYRLIRAGYHVDTQAPLVAQGVGRGGPAPVLMEQRHRSLIRDGNLWEAARDVARQWFADRGYHPLPGSSGLARLARPRIRINAGWWRRQRLRAQVNRLWRLAFNPQPQRVSRREFARLRGEVQDLHAAAQTGMLQFPGPRTTA